MTPAAKNDDDKKRDRTDAQRKDLERLARRATGDPDAKVGGPAGKAGGEPEGPAVPRGGAIGDGKAAGGEGDYGADKIQVLEGLEAVRRRPGMYIGDTTTRGLHHLVYEIVDNSVDEALAGFCKHIHVRITPDEGILVTDDGRGIPVDEVPGQGLPGVTVAFTKLHAGGKFDSGAYKVSGGLHGVGASVVNALSELCEVEVHQKGKVWFQSFERGKPTSKLEVRGKSDKRGTEVYFKADAKIFPIVKYDYGTIVSRLRELAFLNKGLSIGITDERTDPPKEEHFKYDGGIREFVKWLNEGKEVLHNDVIYFEKEADGVAVEIAMQYNTGFNPVEQSFANNIHTLEGGTHLSGFRTALTRRLAEYARREKFFGPEEKPSGDNFREGLTAVISVKVREPQFEGQTKTKLGNSEVEGAVASAFGDALASHLEEHPKTARQILDKAVLAYRAWEAARKAKDLVRRKGALASGNLPGKLADCSSKDLESTELFIVEGESAGGTAKMGRDRATQAILPLRGKILNVEKARLDKMLGHEEIRTLITAVGTGIGRVEEGGEGFDLTKLRYGKIIIMTDADVDGSHIRTLLLTFLFRHMLPLIEAGRVYVAQPPLFRISKRKTEEYVFEEQALKDRLQSLGCESAKFEPAKGEAIQGAALVKVIDALAKLEEQARSVERRNVTLAQYLAAEKDGRLPVEIWRPAKVTGRGNGKPPESELLVTEEDIKRRLASLPADARVVFDTEDPKLREGAVLIRSKVYEHVDLERTVKSLQKLGIDTRTWAPTAAPGASTAAPSGKSVARKPIGRYVLEGADPVEVTSLRDLLLEVRKGGQRGVDVQRYKGLGEMNPDQLKVTTMDPERRTLVKIHIGDGTETDRLFGLLMGESVEPRRQFIEQNAMEVTNLDI